jgi:GT2 family glycosyltransferase
MKVGFVCTNYNNAELTREMIASLHGGGAWDDVQVVVVDNRSVPDDVAVLEDTAREYPGVQLLLQEENRGYFRGLNVGIRHLRAHVPGVQHLVVGNNDLEFPKGFVQKLQEHRTLFDEWAVVAPDLVAPGGQHQNPHVLHPIGAARRAVWGVYFSAYAAALLVRTAARMTRPLTVREENSSASRLHLTAGPIEQGYGACYILGPKFFAHFGGLCAPTFLMQEEFFLGEQLRAIGQLTYYDPRFTVRHLHHATMGTVPSRRHWELSRASHRVYKRYLAMSVEQRRDFILDHSRESA